MKNCFRAPQALFYCLFLLMFHPTANISAFPYSKNPVFTNLNNGDCNINEVIPDLSCRDFLVQVSGESGTLGDDVYLEEVRLVVEHTWNLDLDIYLTSPSGQTVELSTDNGSGGNGYGIATPGCANEFVAFISDLKASDCNTLPINAATPPLIGSYLPEGNLSEFNQGSPNGNWTLNICDDAAPSDGTLQYIELIFSPFVCAVPNFVFADNLDSTFVNINWSGGSGCANTLLEYGPAGFTPGTGVGTVLNVACSPYNLSNLEPNTSYDVYLQESCSAGGFSDYSCPLNFTTLCSPPPATLAEDFDSQNLCASDCNDNCLITGNWFNITGDDTDWLVWQGATPTFGSGPNNDAEDNPTGKYIYVESSCQNGFGNVAELYSQCIEVVASTGNCHLSFDYMINGNTVNDIRLQATSNGSNWLNIWSVTGNRGPEWVRANVDLSSYDGETMQFRFTATMFSGDLGDVALDNIAFHGSTLAGTADFVFYADNDNDNYGADEQTLHSCFNTAPPNYSILGGDCNDNTAFINPGAVDDPCDGTDANCNPADDDVLPPPNTIGNTACSGETDTLYAEALFIEQITWYDAPTDGNLIGSGTQFLPPAQINPGNTPIDVIFYAQKTNFLLGCASQERTATVLTVLPAPETSETYSINICEGESVDLEAYPFIDNHQTDFTLTYHSSLPADESNELANPVVAPTSNSVFFIKASTVDACSDIIPVSISVNSIPQPVIAGTANMCQGSSQVLNVSDANGNNSPYTYIWTTGSSSSSAIVEAPENVGESETYTVRMTAANDCFAEASFTLTTISNTLPNIAAIDVTACGDTDGSITLEPTTGTAPFTYTWEGLSNGSASDNGTSFTINGLGQGAYNITVTDSSDGAACQTVSSGVLVNGPAAVMQIDSLKSAECFGESTGAIYLTTLSATAPTYIWSDGTQTEDNENLSKGMYSVTVSDNGCQNILQNLEVSEPDTLIVKPFARFDASCSDAADGSLEVIIVGGTGEYSMEWSNNDTGTFIQNLSAGNYTATITDANNCVYTGVSYDIEAPPPIETNNTNKVDISCFGETDGRIDLEIQGGAAPYQILWEDGSTSSDLSDLSAGTYKATITDLDGCTHETITYEIEEPSLFAVNLANVDEPDCFGVENGSIFVNVSGGRTPYTYNWSNGVTSFANTGIGAGEYLVTITDSSACVVNDTFLVDAPVAVSAAYDITLTSCFGSSDGEIFVDTSEMTGVRPFTYLWDTGATTHSISNLSKETYALTITDATDCILTDSVTVDANQPIDLDRNITHPNCHGQNTGVINLNPFGGMPLYDVQWSNGMTGENIENLSDGTYFVTVTDGEGCYRLDSIIINEPDPINFNVVSIDSVVCSGSATGSINLNITGGQAPYEYTWVGQGVVSEDLNGVSAGNYSVNVLDENGCLIESPVYTVGEAEPISVADNLFSSNDFNCEDNVAADSLILNITGGQAPYQVLWSTGETTPYLYDVQPDEYYATVTDALGCEEVYFRKVNESYEVLELFRNTPITDCGNTVQNLCINIIGGTAPYNFLWSDSNNGTTTGDEICRNVQVANYSVTVTDDNGCSTILEDITINPIVPFNIYTDAGDVQQISCKDSTDAFIQAQVTGGTPNYDYYWENEAGDNISVQSSLQDLGPGTYFLTVTDAIGCTVTSDWTIVEPTEAITYQAEITDNPCFGDSEGLIDLTVTGGSNSYIYFWSNDQISQDINGLPAGNYGVTIQDANDCVIIIDESEFEVTEPAAPLVITAAVSTDLSCFEGADGTIDIQVEGGTPIYLYDWNISDLPDSGSLSDLAAGIYNCEIFDSNGCQVTSQTFVLDEPDALAAQVIDINAQNNSAEVIASGGTPFGGGSYAVQWSNGETGTIAVNLPQGINTVLISDANGCEIELEFILDETSVLNPEVILSAQLFPNPTNDRVYLDLSLQDRKDLTFTVTDVFGKVIFNEEKANFANGTIAADLSNRPAGLYFLTVQNAGELLGTWRILRH